MIPYIKDIVKDFVKNDDTMKTYANPASYHLFKTREYSTVLEGTHTNIYPNFVANALFYTNKARPEIYTAVEFISMQVRTQDEDEWKKLACMMRYLCGTPKQRITLRADRINLVNWWLDGFHGVQPNCRVHTG